MRHKHIKVGIIANMNNLEKNYQLIRCTILFPCKISYNKQTRTKFSQYSNLGNLLSKISGNHLESISSTEANFGTEFGHGFCLWRL